MYELNSVDEPHPIEAELILFCEVRAGALKPVGTRTGINNDRQPTLLRPSPESLDGRVDHDAVGACKTLRRKWRPTTCPRHVVWYVDRETGATGQVNRYLHQRALFWLTWQPSHHARYAGREIDRLRAHLASLRDWPGRKRRVRHPFIQVVSCESLHRS